MNTDQGSKQRIYCFVEEGGDMLSKEFKTVKELSDFFSDLKSKFPDIDPANEFTIIVGERRCLKESLQGSTYRYKLSKAGCDC